jgi:hypothetical protein
MKLSREAIERLMGPQPTITKTVVVEKTKEGWVPMTEKEKATITRFIKDNPTFSYKELSKKFGRAPSVIWVLCKEGNLKVQKSRV